MGENPSMPSIEESSYNELVNLSGIEKFGLEAALHAIGSLIDLADTLGQEEGAIRALEWSDSLERRGIPLAEAAVLEYFRANAWAARQGIRHRDLAVAWGWEQPEIQNQIFHLRRAINHPGFETLDGLRQCQILTNLGNQLNTVGRFVEALESWARALAIYPNFAMALGNRGNGLAHYTRALYDGGHRALFLRFAYADFAATLAPDALYDSPQNDEVRSSFEAMGKSIEALMGAQRLSEALDLDSYELGASKEEQDYRRWCLGRGLFLNPLNDLGKHAIAAQDVLTLPDFVTPIDEPPALIGLFNQMKQEFVSARWLYYEGTHSDDVHHSDRGVLLYNTLDYPIYSLAIEKVKAAFRSAYSLFDKIGLFLDCYMKLGIKPEQITFRKIWQGKEIAGKRTVRSEFERSKNWPLRGLFWLSKDLFEMDFRDVMEPDARALHEMRNRLEHRYLKVHDLLFESLRERDLASGPWNDRLAFSVQRRDFEAKALRLLKLARAALIYVSLGMHAEEKRRRAQEGDKTIMPMHLDTWDDDWKR
jgi:hypothetical protein